MLTMATSNVRFATKVGVAPSTTTMALGATHPRFYMPYASLEDLRSTGFGIVNESDAWLTGRPYGLPGTAAIRLRQRPGGYHSPQGHHYDVSMLGDADSANIALQLQSLVASQQAQQKSIDRIAFWQALSGGIAVTAMVVGVVAGVAGYVRNRGDY